jgi:hypothetical protein
MEPETSFILIVWLREGNLKIFIIQFVTLSRVPCLLLLNKLGNEKKIGGSHKDKNQNKNRDKESDNRVDHLGY